MYIRLHAVMVQIIGKKECDLFDGWPEERPHSSSHIRALQYPYCLEHSHICHYPPIWYQRHKHMNLPILTDASVFNDIRQHKMCTTAPSITLPSQRVPNISYQRNKTREH
ncbi:hypothetical protein TNCV_3654591 [Trichonephila clavipes]|nr:hypothetical protein TNCV_3654591 [Trichonephila clavipes]